MRQESDIYHHAQTPREDLARERERIATDVEAFLAGGGTITHPEPRQYTATTGHRGAGSTYRNWSIGNGKPPNLSSVRKGTPEQRRKALEANRAR